MLFFVCWFLKNHILQSRRELDYTGNNTTDHQRRNTWNCSECSRVDPKILSEFIRIPYELSPSNLEKENKVK